MTNPLPQTVPVTTKRKMTLIAGVFLSFLLLKACAPDRATWYGHALRGRRMANGHPFNPDAFTAASWDYPLGTRLKISHAEKTVIVEITDRGGEPVFLQWGRTIDLSHAAFSKLADPRTGSIRVKISKEKEKGKL